MRTDGERSSHQMQRRFTEKPVAMRPAPRWERLFGSQEMQKKQLVQELQKSIRRHLYEREAQLM